MEHNLRTTHYVPCLSPDHRALAHNLNSVMTNESIQISDREREILRLVATGATNQQIAARLNISINTVKVHLRNIFGKIGAASRTEATLYAVRTGIVSVGQATLAPEAVAVAVSEAPTDEETETGPPNLPPAERPADWEAAAEPANNEFITEAPSIALSPQAMPATSAETELRPRALLNKRRLLITGAMLSFIIGAGVLLRFYFWTAPASQPTVTPTSAAVAIPGPSWRELAPLPTGRASFALTSVSYEGKRYLYAIAGEIDSTVSDQVVRYDLTTNTWASLSPKPTAVDSVQAVVIGNRIYVPGGRTASGAITDALEAYDPQHDRWAKLKPLPQPRSAYALAVIEGKMYLFGGWDGSTYRGEVWQYDPDKDDWTVRTAMPTPRAFAVAAVVENAIYVLGGENSSGRQTVNERYIPSDDLGSGTPWSTKLPLPTPAEHMAVASINDQLFVLGGTGNTNDLMIYNSNADQWRSDTIPLDELRDLRAQGIGTKLYIVGGRGANALSTHVYEYQAIYSVLLPVVVK
jgi:DNA-binding CsgD family transcriptional regulator